MATGPAGTSIDQRPIQEVTLVDYQGNFATASGASAIPVQGPYGAGTAGGSINPILIGGLDTNNPQQIQPAQLDANLNLDVTMGTKLDPYNDALNAIQSFGYPTAQRATPSANGSTTLIIPLAPASATASGAPTPLANSLGLAGLPNAAPVHWARFTVSNNGTNQPITALKVSFYDTVDSTTDTLTYTYPLTISQANGTVARYWMPMNQHYGIYPNAQMVLTFNAAASTGYVQTQTLWGFTPITSFPFEWQWTFATQIQGSSSTQLVAAPPSNTRICIEELMVTNASASAATDFAFQSGNNGSTLFQAEAYYQGMGFKYGPYPFESPYRMALATALFGKCTASSNIWVTGRGHYEPI